MASLEQLIGLRALMREVRLEGWTTIGFVTIDQHVIRLLDAVEQEVTVRRGEFVCTPHQLAMGDVVTISFDGEPSNYYERFADFLKHFPDKPPAKCFYIYDLQFRSGADEPELLQQYRDAVRLWRVLSDLADHKDNRRLFLLSSDKVEIECVYTKDDLRRLEKLRSLEADFGEGAASHEEKRTLFKRALQEELGRCTPQQRFSTLLRNFASVYDRYWHNFKLFLEQISFDAIFEGYVEKHSKLITELNSVLGGIQTALIGLPIASFVILEKMAVADHPVFKNTLLALGCIVFVGFLFLLSFSQGRTLHASKALAMELDDDIKSKSPDLAKKLEPSMRRLCRHASWVTTLLVTVRVLLVGLLVATALTYAYVSFPNSREWVNASLRSLNANREIGLERLEAAIDSAKTRAETDSASKALADYWDARLGVIERKIEGELEPAAITAFRQSMIAWRDYRAAQVRANAAASAAGNIKPRNSLATFYKLTAQRTRELETSFENGSLFSPP